MKKISFVIIIITIFVSSISFATNDDIKSIIKDLDSAGNRLYIEQNTIASIRPYDKDSIVKSLTFNLSNLNDIRSRISSLKALEDDIDNKILYDLLNLVVSNYSIASNEVLLYVTDENLYKEYYSDSILRYKNGYNTLLEVKSGYLKRAK